MSSSPKSRKQSAVSDINAALDSYLSNSRNKPPLGMKSRIFQCIARRRIDAAESKNYLLAAKLATAEQELRKYYSNGSPTSRTGSEFGSSARVLRTKLQNARQDFDARIEDYKQQRSQFMSDLKRQHDFELSEFAARWKDPQSFAYYAKSSSHLLQLRDIERKKVILQDYEGAEETRRVADSLEKRETKDAQEKAILCMKSQLEQLEKKHQMEVEAAERMTKKKIDHLTKEKNAVVVPLELALKRAEERESKPDLRRRSTTSMKNLSYDVETDETNLATPRTFRKMYDMRAPTGVRHLELQGIDITQYLTGAKTARPRSRSIQRGSNKC